MTIPNITEQKNWFESNPKKTIAFIVIFGFLIIDFSLAAALKIVGVFKPSYVTSNVREAYYRRADPVYHHGLKKNISNYIAEWGKQDYRVDTNSLGFKDNGNQHVPLESKHKRIIVIGDSFTEGMAIPFDKTFAGLLKNNFKQYNVDVLNAAASSYSPIIYYRKIKYLIETVGLKFDSVVVLIDLSDAEDEALGYRFDKDENVISQGSAANLGAAESKHSAKPKNIKQPMTVKDFFTQYTYFLGQLRNLSAYLKAKTRSWERGLKQRRAMWTMDKSLYNEFGEKGLTIGAKHMLQLKNLLDKQQISLTVVVYPWPDQIYNDDFESKQVNFWYNWSRKNKVEFINLFNAFVPTTTAEETIRKYYINGDVHWNEVGHKRVFQVLKTRLQP
ncbi:hypothetical protein MNBD_GAMMA23-1478 [hydrothermal vent metagenome]|uniref:AlgX/AlgJ SGNH hydrolase-like domain-containing protein n=1 Tax=hydrothermal vent metagenome TaxID=652676 RepID=A0A3B1AYM9_9ZZZZ